VFAVAAAGLRSRLVKFVKTVVQLLFHSIISTKRDDCYYMHKTSHIGCATVESPQLEGSMRLDQHRGAHCGEDLY
jgi:hypothetical protein